MKKISLILSILILVFIVVGCGGQSESSAKNTLEAYLKNMKKGDTEQAGKYLSDTENLIDVFKYEYLDTISEDEELIKEIMTEHDFENDEYYVEKYKNWYEYKKHIKESYGKNESYVVKDEGLTITHYKKGNMKKIYTFLYDMEVANGLGNKLFKKIEYTVEWDDYHWNGEDFVESFVISNINIRGNDE